jgi:hypothetical protein
MLETVILLLAALVLVPLGLHLSDDPKRGAFARQLLSMANWFQPPAAISLGASFAFAQGGLAAGMAAPWFAVTLLIAATGVLDGWRRGWRIDSTTGFTAAYLFLPVGGGWAVISRAGLNPQNFSDAIVLLTAVHFHYAGFVLPIVAGLTAGRAGSVSPLSRTVMAAMLAATLLGVPLVGVGISLSPHVEVAAAMLLALGCTILAVRQIQVALATREPTCITLLTVSSLSLLSAMALAAVYAVGEVTGQTWLAIPTMICTHGAANAFGFATCGLAGWEMWSGRPDRP